MTAELNPKLSYLIKPDGTVRELISSPEIGSFSLEQLYAEIGCNMIEVLNMADGRIMIIDEEGKFKQEAQENKHATQLMRLRLHEYDFIVGNIIVCPSSMLK